MSVIINPGSGAVADAGEGWTNTYDGAVAEAWRWWHRMVDDGIRDVFFDGTGESDGEGRWRFQFVHTVTGKAVELVTHGVNDIDAYMAERLFAPRIYWNGSSSGEPRLLDWGAAGFEPVKTWRATR